MKLDLESLLRGHLAEWAVVCARCGDVGTTATYMLEEGDEWECPTCWERCEATERAKSNEVP